MIILFRLFAFFVVARLIQTWKCVEAINMIHDYKLLSFRLWLYFYLLGALRLIVVKYRFRLRLCHVSRVKVSDPRTQRSCAKWDGNIFSLTWCGWREAPWSKQSVGAKANIYLHLTPSIEKSFQGFTCFSYPEGKERSAVWRMLYINCQIELVSHRKGISPPPVTR